MLTMDMLLLLLYFSVTLELAFSQKVLHVDSVSGNDSDSCLESNADIPCQSLEYISLKLSQQGTNQYDCSNLAIIIDSPTLVVQDTVSFESCKNLTITSAPNLTSDATITCTLDCRSATNVFRSHFDFMDLNRKHTHSPPDLDKYCVPNDLFQNCTSRFKAGFIFDNIQDLGISNVVIQNCGVNIPQELSAAVHVRDCFNVVLNNISFEESQGTALALRNTLGNVTVQNVRFLNNTHSINDSFVGGVCIRFSEPASTAAGAYSFKDCSFAYNSAPCYRAFKPKMFPKLSDFDTFGLGGGLSLLFANGTKDIHVSIEHCTFVNNSAPWGAGLYVHFQDDVVDRNVVTVSDSKFFNNTAYLAGGGVMVGYDKITSRVQVNTVSFMNASFISNHARYGGATSLIALYSEFKSQPNRSVVFNNCTWVNNSAFYSPAVDISPFRFDELNTGFLPIPVFKDCLFKHNRLTYRMVRHTSETGYITAGVFVITRFTVMFLGNNTFIKNKYNALLLNSATCIFNPGSNVVFHSNTGIKGAGIAMYGFSVLNLNDDSNFTFINNLARDVGGGIYYHSNEQRDFLEGRSCFLQYIGESKPPRVRFHFEKNKASNGGSSIYSVSFYSCFYRYLDNLHKHKLADFFHKIGNFEFKDSTTEQHLATVGMNYSYDSTIKSLEAIPGKPVFVPIRVLDEFGANISTELLLKGNHVSVREHYTSNNSFAVLGHPNDSGSVEFTTEHSIREVYYKLNVTLKQCPPGYFLNSTTSSISACQCSADNATQTYKGITKCSDTEFKAFVRHGFWVGFYPADNNTDPNSLYTAYCPLQFCQMNYVNYHFNQLPSSSDQLNVFVCGGRRKGIVCGQCTENRSVSFHSRHFKCNRDKLCHLGLLFYILSEIFPMMILFTVVITFNVSFTSGGVSGLILFSQLVDRLTIDYRHFGDHHKAKFGPLNALRDVYLLIYGIFNFDFFSIEKLSFCLWKGATVMDALVFKYITTLTALVLVVCLVGIMNSKHRLKLCNAKKRVVAVTKKSIIHGLSAFLIICYAQCTTVTFSILTKSDLWGNSHAQPHYLSVSYYGGLPYFQGKHLMYAIPALLFLVTIVSIPPILLFFHPLLLHLLALCGQSEHPCVTYFLRAFQFHRLMPLFDSFQSTFKDKMRFFAGLYFMCRVAVLAAYTFSQGALAFYGVSELFLVLFLGANAIAQPHNSRKHNVIDALMILNLVVINGLTMYATQMESKCNENETAYDHTALTLIAIGTLQLVLVFAPILGVVCYCLYMCKKSVRPTGGERDLENQELLFSSNINRSGDYGTTRP